MVDRDSEVSNAFADVFKGGATGGRGAPKNRYQMVAAQLKTLVKGIMKVAFAAMSRID